VSVTAESVGRFIDVGDGFGIAEEDTRSAVNSPEMEAIMPKCPQCKRKPVSFTEVWSNHSIYFEVDENGEPEKSGYTIDGSPAYVNAYCANCDYEWRLRGVNQITDLRSGT